jgi:DNA-binding CsgD family transcriptional regulator
MRKHDKINANVFLSPREKQLLRRLAQNKSDKQIAAEIGGRTDHIALQRLRLIEKLQIQSQGHLSALTRHLAAWKPSKDYIK